MVPWLRRHRKAIAVTTVLSAAALSCASEGEEVELRRILENDRAAHLAADAARLTANLADTLIVLDGALITPQTRQEIEVMFRAYFEGASYHEWDDLEDPVIRISTDGSMAWVARRVRVDRTAPRFGGGTQRERFESSWTATYERAGGAWKMTSVTSTFARMPSAAQVLSGARRALCGDDAIANVRFAQFRADVSGPGGDFRVTVQSSAAGAVRIDFSTGFSAAITYDDAWMRPTPGDTAFPLPDTLETFVRGHDLLMNALYPARDYGPLRFAGRESFGAVP